MSGTEMMHVKIKKLELDNVGDGAAKEQFAEALEQVSEAIRQHIEALQDGGVYATKENTLQFVITPKIALNFNTETMGAEVLVSTDIKMPGRKAVRRPVHLKGSTFLMEEEPHQEPLFSTKRVDS
jgi:biotin operon repressor